MLTVVTGLGEVPQLEEDRVCEERDAALDRKLKDPRGLVARKAALAYLVQKMCSLWNGKQKILNWGCFCQYGFMSQFIEGIEPIYIEYLVHARTAQKLW